MCDEKRKQAIFRSAEVVVKALHNQSIPDDTNYLFYMDHRIEINYRRDSSFLQIFLNGNDRGRLVFGCNGDKDVYAYFPGSWETHIAKLEQSARMHHDQYFLSGDELRYVQEAQCESWTELHCFEYE